MDSAPRVGMVISLTTWIKSWPTYRFNWCWGPTRIHHAPWPFHDARPTPSVVLRKTRTAYPWPSCPCARWWRPLGCQTSSHAREWWRRGRTALWGRLGLSGWRMAPGWMVVRYVNASEQFWNHVCGAFYCSEHKSVERGRFESPDSGYPWFTRATSLLIFAQGVCGQISLHPAFPMSQTNNIQFKIAWSPPISVQVW